MSYERLCSAGREKLTVGAKETLKALRKSKVETAFIARDAEERIIGPVKDACREKNIPYQEVETMKHLGKACGIAVGCSAAALLKD